MTKIVKMSKSDNQNGQATSLSNFSCFTIDNFLHHGSCRGLNRVLFSTEMLTF